MLAVVTQSLLTRGTFYEKLLAIPRNYRYLGVHFPRCCYQTLRVARAHSLANQSYQTVNHHFGTKAGFFVPASQIDNRLKST